MKLLLTLTNDDGTETTAEFIQFVEADKETWPKSIQPAIVTVKGDTKLDFPMFINSAMVYSGGFDGVEEVSIFNLDNPKQDKVTGDQGGEAEDSFDYNSADNKKKFNVFFKKHSDTATCVSFFNLIKD